MAGSASNSAPSVVRVACVGDSITAGVGTSGGGRTYPAVLRGLLGKGWTVDNFGDSGKTMMKRPGLGHTSYWDTRTFAASQAFAPDRVVIMLGTNDAKTANWHRGGHAYEDDCRAMLAVFAALATRPRIFVALPPPALLASFTIAPLVIANTIVPALRRIAAETGTGLIDVHGAFRPSAARFFGGGDGRDIGDGVHPNDAGAALIAQTVAAALTRPIPPMNDR
jgi:acyl-CoA thioesterase-1